MLLYFVDGRQRITLTEAHALGLRHAFPLTPPVCSEFSDAGPHGEAGVVLAAQSDRIGYYPDRQTWRRMPPIAGQPCVSVGFWNDARPTPESLRVEQPLRGSAVRLRDGNDWIVPLARAWSDDARGGAYCALPGTLTLDDAGEWQRGGIESRYAQLWDLATQYWDSLWSAPLEGQTVRFDFPRAHDAAVEALGANYRISRGEVALLGLFDDQWLCATAILQALVDYDTFMSWAKKNLPPPVAAGSNSSAGAPAEIPTTVPRSPTSGRSPKTRSQKSEVRSQ